VIVKDGRIVGEGYNNVVSRNDPTWCVGYHSAGRALYGMNIWQVIAGLEMLAQSACKNWGCDQSILTCWVGA
jgi:hypothetical protein